MKTVHAQYFWSISSELGFEYISVRYPGDRLVLLVLYIYKLFCFFCLFLVFLPYVPFQFSTMTGLE